MSIERRIMKKDDNNNNLEEETNLGGIKLIISHVNKREYICTRVNVLVCDREKGRRMCKIIVHRIIFTFSFKIISSMEQD
jgi:hypothetical protein